jgi:hypothetical protein
MVRIFPFLIDAREAPAVASISSQQLLGDSNSLHVAGPFIDSTDFGVAIEFLNRIVLRKPDSPEDLYSGRRDLFGDL